MRPGEMTHALEAQVRCPQGQSPSHDPDPVNGLDLALPFQRLTRLWVISLKKHCSGRIGAPYEVQTRPESGWVLGEPAGRTKLPAHCPLLASYIFSI